MTETWRANGTVKFYNKPKENKTWGSIMLDNGERYALPPEFVGRFSETEYVEFDWSAFGQGGKKVTKKIEVAQAQPSPPPVGHNNPPKVNGNGRAGYNNNPGAAIMGMVNQFIGRGDVHQDAEAIARLIDLCADAYGRSILAQEIPF